MVHKGETSDRHLDNPYKLKSVRIIPREARTASEDEGML